MAFNSTLLTALKTQHPVIALQVGIRQTQTFWLVDSAGIWMYDLRGTYSDFDTDLTDGAPTLPVVSVNSVTVDGTDLTEVTSYTNTIDGRATALATAASFIYDDVNDIIYARFDALYNPPLIYDINIGAVLGLSDNKYYDYVNGVNYSPDLENTPQFPQRKDPIFFQQMQFDSFVQNIDNSDYSYDDRKGSNLFGSTADYYLGTKDLAFEYFEKIYEGRVIKSAFQSSGTWALSIRDSRKALSNTIANNYIDGTVYTDADDYALSTPAPILYGMVTGVKCISLQEEQTGSPSTYAFLFADASVYDYYVSGAVIKVDGAAVTPSTAPDGSTGLFALAVADYDPGQEVTYTGGGIVDGSAVLIDNQLDIAQHLLENFASISYTGNNFNTAEWTIEQTKASDNIGVAIIDGTTTVISVLEELAQTSAAGFLRQPDGLLTWRTFDADNLPIATIKTDDWLDDPRLDNDADQVISKAGVKYDQDVSSGLWLREIDDSKEAAVKGTYDTNRSKEFETLYTDSADALLFAQDIMNKSDAVRDIITGTVRLEFIEPEIGQNVQIELDHTNGTSWLGKLKCEVLESIPDIRNGRLRLVLRAFEVLTDFTYVHDFNGDSTTDIFDFNSTTAAIVDYGG